MGYKREKKPTRCSIKPQRHNDHISQSTTFQPSPQLHSHNFQQDLEMPVCLNPSRSRAEKLTSSDQAPGQRCEHCKEAGKHSWVNKLGDTCDICKKVVKTGCQ
jgi:hypothetical protein